MSNIDLKDIKVHFIEKFSIKNLKVIGNFRKENASAALTVVKVLKLDNSKAINSVQSFAGLGRRLEYKGKIKSTIF